MNNKTIFEAFIFSFNSSANLRLEDALDFKILNSTFLKNFLKVLFSSRTKKEKAKIKAKKSYSNQSAVKKN